MISEKQRDELISAASAIRNRAYAPQSNFHVGAAVLAEDGSIFPGVNVENSSYGLTCCAERTALFSAVTAGHNKFLAIAVSTDGGYAPCGACRQVIVELAPEAIVYLVNASDGNSFAQTSIDELLPNSFRLAPRSPE